MSRLESAQHYLKNADHLLSVTYPLVKESKLLLSIVDSLNKCAGELIAALKERYPSTPKIENSWGFVQTTLIPHYKIPHHLVEALITLRETQRLHRQSAVEFQHQDKLVMCDNRYQLRILTPKEVKELLKHMKEFLKRVEAIDRKA